METLKSLYGQLRLRINEAKSAIDRPWNRKFLGYTFWVAKGREVKRKVAPKALEKFKARIRELTDRSGGQSMKLMAAGLRSYLAGWKEYFRLAQTPSIFRGLDEWIRHRLRMVQLKQWKRGPTIYREMKRLGAAEDVARKVAANSRRWWKNSEKLLNTALPNSYYDRMGVPRLAT
jgi:RNA-directed DNA polymerase